MHVGLHGSGEQKRNEDKLIDHNSNELMPIKRQSHRSSPWSLSRCHSHRTNHKCESCRIASNMLKRCFARVESFNFEWSHSKWNTFNSLPKALHFAGHCSPISICWLRCHHLSTGAGHKTLIKIVFFASCRMFHISLWSDYRLEVHWANCSGQRRTNPKSSTSLRSTNWRFDQFTRFSIGIWLFGSSHLSKRFLFHFLRGTIPWTTLLSESIKLFSLGQSENQFHRISPVHFMSIDSRWSIKKIC